MNVKVETAPYQRIILSDIFILIMVYFIPAMSHFTPIPLYLLDPMRFFLLIGFLLSKNNINGYILAFTIPLFSMFTSGHPPFYKSLLICIELVTNLALFNLLLQRFKTYIPIALFSSIVASKVIYYALKYLFIQCGLISGELITTSLWMQLVTALIITVLFSFFFKRDGRTSL